MNASVPQESGRPFACRRCGACCRWPGYVRIDAAEADAIAGFLGLPVPRFLECYTLLTADRRGLSLVEAPGSSACIFLEADNRCRIQAVKPRQCREFPHGWRNPDAACPAWPEK